MFATTIIFMVVYTIEYRDYEDLIQALENNSQKIFKIGDTTFLKKDLNSLAVAGQGFGFIFMDLDD